MKVALYICLNLNNKCNIYGEKKAIYFCVNAKIFGMSSFSLFI